MNDSPPVTLTIVPVEITQRDDRDALAEASGRNLAAEWATRASILSGLALCAVVLLAIFLSGCTRPITTAVIAANETRAMLDIGRVSIDERCIPAYQAAKTLEDVAKVDKVCLPARGAYLTTRAAWMGATAIILGVRAGGDEAQLVPVALRLANAVTELANAIGQVSK